MKSNERYKKPRQEPEMSAYTLEKPGFISSDGSSYTSHSHLEKVLLERTLNPVEQELQAEGWVFWANCTTSDAINACLDNLTTLGYKALVSVEAFMNDGTPRTDHVRIYARRKDYDRQEQLDLQREEANLMTAFLRLKCPDIFSDEKKNTFYSEIK